MYTYQKFFRHDCDECIFIGNSYEKGKYDLYYCPRAEGGSVIARFGNNGPEYMSYTLTSAIRFLGENHPIARAVERAVYLGHIKGEQLVKVIGKE